jgi:putative Mn2+ efflux pump MntP
LIVPHDLVLMAKVLGVALAVGLDVLAVSVGVGVMHLVLNVRLRLGFAFAGPEIAMQVIGYEVGAGAGKMLGEVATYVGLALLATIGCLMIRNSLQRRSKPEFDATRGAGLLITSLSISLDSLGVGIALPSVGIPLLPLLIMCRSPQPLLPLSDWHLARVWASGTSTVQNVRQVRCS